MRDFITYLELKFECNMEIEMNMCCRRRRRAAAGVTKQNNI